MSKGARLFIADNAAIVGDGFRMAIDAAHLVRIVTAFE